MPSAPMAARRVSRMATQKCGCEDENEIWGVMCDEHVAALVERRAAEGHVAFNAVSAAEVARVTDAGDEHPWTVEINGIDEEFFFACRADAYGFARLFSDGANLMAVESINGGSDGFVAALLAVPGAQRSGE